MNRNIELKDCIRWLDLGDQKVLQVRGFKFHPEGSPGQGAYEEIWSDVPIAQPANIVKK